MSQVLLYPHINHSLVLLFKDSISGTEESAKVSNFHQQL